MALFHHCRRFEHFTLAPRSTQLYLGPEKELVRKGSQLDIDCITHWVLIDLYKCEASTIYQTHLKGWKRVLCSSFCLPQGFVLLYTIWHPIRRVILRCLIKLVTDFDKVFFSGLLSLAFGCPGLPTRWQVCLPLRLSWSTCNVAGLCLPDCPGLPTK